MGALLLVRLADEAGSFLPFGAAPQLRDSLDLTYAQLALLLTAMPAGGLVGLACSVLADLVSRRALAATGTAVLAVAMATFALSDSFALLVVASFVYGAASDAMVSACEVALADVAGEDLDRLLARQNVWATVGDLTGPALVAGALAATGSVRPAFGVAAFGLAAYAWWLGSLPLPPPRAPGADHVRARFGILLRDPRVWVLGLVAACLFPLDEALLAVLVLRLAPVSGDGVAAVVVAGAGVVGGLAGLLVAPRWSARRGRRHALGSGAVVAAVSVTIAAAGPPVLAVAGALGAGFGVAVAWIAFQATLLRLLPGGEGATSAVVGVLELAGLAVPLVAGVVADGSGLPAAIAVYAATGALSALLVIVGLGREPVRAET